MPRRATDPYANFNFLLEIDGITNAGFSECSGLNMENTPIEYREGADTFLTPRKQPGLMKYGNITLKRGITQNPELVTWLVATESGDVERRTVSIVLLDELRQESVRWNLREAWASKWMGPDLKANASEMAIETLEITHEGLVRQ
jgi:phage tail-like protein